MWQLAMGITPNGLPYLPGRAHYMQVCIEYLGHTSMWP